MACQDSISVPLHGGRGPPSYVPVVTEKYVGNSLSTPLTLPSCFLKLHSVMSSFPLASSWVRGAARSDL